MKTIKKLAEIFYDYLVGKNLVKNKFECEFDKKSVDE